MLCNKCMPASFDRIRPRFWMLLAILVSCSRPGFPVASGAELMYVALGTTNQIVTFDISLGNSTDILNSKQTFASTNMSQPYGLTFDNSGNLYVANQASSLVTKFNSSGVFDSYFGGNPNTNLNGAVDVAFDSSGNLFVSNSGFNRISKFDSSGVYQTTGSITSSVANLNGIAFSSSGNLYAANAGAANTISIFSSTGSFLSNITGLSGPRDLTFDAADNLYVVNGLANSVRKYNSSGVFQTTITGNMSSPMGIVFDSSGNMYVSNNESNTISKFNASGAFQFAWSTGASTGPRYMVLAPEPSTWFLGGLSFAGILLTAIKRKKTTQKRTNWGHS